MLLSRYVERSVYEAVKALYVTPQTGMTNAFNVYGEDAFWNPDTSPTFPYLWFMGYRVAPRVTRLPLLILDMGSASNNPIEIGRRDGTYTIATVHVFAKTRGEREDLADVIYQNIYNIPISDYSNASPTFKYNVQVESRYITRQGVAEELGKEGTLTNWKTVQFAFQLFE